MALRRVEFPLPTTTFKDMEGQIEFVDIGLREAYSRAADSMMRLKAVEGRVLELGSGFGFLGMMLCARNEFLTVAALERSRVMVKAAETLSIRRRYNSRISYKVWDAASLPFGDSEFDAVVSFFSLHRWQDPEKTFAEIQRVRRKDSLVYVADLKRNQRILPFMAWVARTRLKRGKSAASYLTNALKASFTTSEIKRLLGDQQLTDWQVEENGRWLRLYSTHRREGTDDT